MKTAILLAAIVLVELVPGFSEERSTPPSQDYLMFTTTGESFRAGIVADQGEYLVVVLGCCRPCIILSKDIDHIERWTPDSVANVPLGTPPSHVNVSPIVQIPCTEGTVYWGISGLDWAMEPFGRGYLALVDHIALAGPMDAQLQRYVDDYRKRVQIGRTMYWPGLVLGCAGGFGCFTSFAAAGGEEPPSPELTRRAWITCSVSACIGIGGYLLARAGQNYAGKPNAVVNYYNETYARR